MSQEPVPYIGTTPISLEEGLDYAQTMDRLEKRGFTLARYKEIGMSIAECFALSLLQHSSGFYCLTDLGPETRIAIGCNEETWLQFLVKLGELSKTPLKQMIPRVVKMLSEHLNCFQDHLSNDSSVIIIYFAHTSKCFSYTYPAEKKTRSNKKFFLWHDEKRNMFESIAPISSVYTDSQTCWEVLLSHLSDQLTVIYSTLFSTCRTDEELEKQCEQCLNDITASECTVKSYSKLLANWNNEITGSGGILEQMASCGDQLGADQVKENCLDLQHEMIKYLHSEFDQAITRLKEKNEANLRKCVKTAEEAEDNIYQLEKEIAELEGKISDKNRAEVEEKEAKLAWNWFVVKLNNLTPLYELSRDRAKHRLLKERDMGKLVWDILADVKSKSEVAKYAPHLWRYIQTHKDPYMLQRQLRTMLMDTLGKPMIEPRKHPWRVRSRVLVISNVLNYVKALKTWKNCEEIHLCASRIIYVDTNINTPGVSVALSAPHIKVIGNDEVLIDTSGQDAYKFKTKKANKGNGPGMSGGDGMDGAAGQSAGHVTVLCRLLSGRLRIEAKGGDGADGQDGGDGTAGYDGEDGRSGSYPEKPEPGKDHYWLQNLIDRKNLRFVDGGRQGTPGRSGGSGGRGGLGGEGGRGGRIHIECGRVNGEIQPKPGTSEGENGSDGNDGQPGKGSSGGGGGTHGYDAIVIFEPDDLKPIIKVTGYWCRYLDDRNRITGVYPKWIGNEVIGYKLDPNSKTGNRRALNGERGQQGRRADARQRKKAKVKTDMSQVKTEREEQQEDQTEEVEVDGSHVDTSEEQQSIDKKKADIEEQQRIIATAELDQQQLQEDHVRMNAVQQRVKAKLQQVLSEHISQRSTTTSQVHRLATMDFEDVDDSAINQQKELQQSRPSPLFVDESTLSSKPEEIPKQLEPRMKWIPVLDALILRKSGGSKLEDMKTKLSYLAQFLAGTYSSNENRKHFSVWCSISAIVARHDVTQLNAQLEQDVQRFQENKNDLVEYVWKRAESFKSESLNESLLDCIINYEEDGGPNLTERLGNIFHEHVFAQLPQLVVVLEHIVEDLPFALSIVSNGQEQLLQPIKSYVEKYGRSVDIGDVVSLLLEFRGLPHTYNEIRKLLEQVVQSRNNISEVQRDCHRQLFNIIIGRLSSIVADAIDVDNGSRYCRILLNLINLCGTIDQPNIHNFFHLLALELGIVDESNSSQTTNIEDLSKMDPKEREKKIATIKANIVHLDSFIRAKLGIKKHVQDILGSASKEKLIFLLHNTEMTVKDLQDIRSWVECEDDSDDLIAMVDSVFANQYWNTKWDTTYQQVLKLTTNDPRKDELEHALERFRKVLEWRHNDVPYEDRLRLLDECSKLKTVDSFISWADKKLEAVVSSRTTAEEAGDILAILEQLKAAQIQGNNTSTFGSTMFNKVGFQRNSNGRLNVNEWRPKLRKIHFLMEQDFLSLTSEELRAVTNFVFSDIRLDGNEDASLQRHWKYFKSTFEAKWMTFYVGDWSNCYRRVKEIQEKLRNDWTKEREDQQNVYEDDDEPATETLNKDVHLYKYALFTLLFLSPSEALKRWRSLEQLTVAEQEHTIRQYLGQDVWNDRNSSLNELLVKVEKIIQKDLAQPIAARGLPDEQLLSDIDAVFAWLRKLEQKPTTEQEHTLFGLLDKMKVLVEYRYRASDGASSKQSTPTVDAWRETTKQAAEHIPEDLLKGFSELIDLVSYEWCDNHKATRDQNLANRIEEHYVNLEETLDSLRSLIHQLIDTRSKISFEKVIRASVTHLKDGECIAPYSRNSDDGLLKSKLAICKECIPGIDWPVDTQNLVGFVDAMLKSTNDDQNTAWIRVVLFEEICDQLIHEDQNSVVDWNILSTWYDGLTRIISCLTEDGADTAEKLSNILNTLAELCRHCYIRSSVAADQKDSSIALNNAKYNFESALNQLKAVARFITTNPDDSIRIGKFVLGGLIQMGHEQKSWSDELVRTTLGNYIEKSARSDPQLRPNDQKKSILSFLYPKLATALAGDRLRLYMERWISAEQCHKDLNKMKSLHGLITKASVDPNELFKVSGCDIYTDDERAYIDLVGEEIGQKVINKHNPNSYLHQLRKEAIRVVQLNLLHHFDPKLTEEDAEKLKSSGVNPFEARSDLSELVRSFYASLSAARKDSSEDSDVLCSWLVGIQQVVIPLLATCIGDAALPVKEVSVFLKEASRLPLNMVIHTASFTRPHQWVDHLLVKSICRCINKLYKWGRPDESGDDGSVNVSKYHSTLIRNLRDCLRHDVDKRSRRLLTILRDKLEREAQIALVKPLDSSLLADLVVKLKSMSTYTVEDLIVFQMHPLEQWPTVIRRTHLASKWSPELADLMVGLVDLQFGADGTDRIAQRLKAEYLSTKPLEQHNGIFTRMIKNLYMFPWIGEKWIQIINQTGQQNLTKNKDLWNLLCDAEKIESNAKQTSSQELSDRDILSIMKNDPESRDVVDGKKLLQQLDAIKKKSEEISKWTSDDIASWSQSIQQQANQLDVVEFLAVASQAVQLKCQFRPRNTQLSAVLIFSSPSTEKDCRRRMAQISTGEGKTLITALLAINHVLSHWRRDRHVDVITSSPVLAQENVKEISWLFEQFGVSVSTNCDPSSSSNDAIRRERYNCDVVYGDLSSFQRDILLTRFLGKDITRNREAGATIIDEVDSMLLDKGENTLYLSHDIPEMLDLMHLFVEVWNASTAPDVTYNGKESVSRVLDFIRPRISDCSIAVPKCLSTFIERHLEAWVRSAFRAQQLTLNDAYKVDDIGDGRGQRIVIMDKDTGTEQVGMQWTDGLQQALELKHSLKLSPISLKAIFMSNIGYFDQLPGRLYGVTGTLGSVAECSLLRRVFGVDFFKVPRFRLRFCYQLEPLLANSEEDWLKNLEHAVRHQLENPGKVKGERKAKAVLIVSENVAAANAIHKQLSAARLSIQLGPAEQLVKVALYISSFDKAFQEKLHKDKLQPGDVIVATNLAGRGTDFKIHDRLNEHGGLHVIISYMPPNARVEAQAEGRTARAGQPGSGQLVVWHPSVNTEKDPLTELHRLKLQRDREESQRLERIRIQSVPRVKLEEQLFAQFRAEVYEPVRKALLRLGEDEMELQQRFMLDRWALWLDDNYVCISNAHRGQSSEAVSRFVDFRNDMLAVSHNQWDRILYASTVSQLLALGDLVERSSAGTDFALQCYKRVCAIEPDWCESALISRSYLAMKEPAGFSVKMDARKLLNNTKQLITKRIDLFTSLGQVMKKSAENQMAKGIPISMERNRFQEQVTNSIRLLRVHSSAIDDLLGSKLNQTIARHFANEDESRDLTELLDNVEDTSLLKPFRVSRKVTFDSKDNPFRVKEKSMEWPPFSTHCRVPIARYIDDALRNAGQRRVKLSGLQKVIVDEELRIWEELVRLGFLDKGVKRTAAVIYRPSSDSDGGLSFEDLPEGLTHYSTAIESWLKEHYEDEFDIAVASLKLDTKLSEQLKNWLKTKKHLMDAVIRQHRLLKSIPINRRKQEEPEHDGQTNEKLSVTLPPELAPHNDLLATWIQTELKVKDVVTAPRFEDRALKIGSQFWNHLVYEGVVKVRSVRFDFSDLSADEIESRIKKIHSYVDGWTVLDDICRRHRTPPERQVNVSVSDISAYLSDNPASRLAEKCQKEVEESSVLSGIVNAVSSAISALCTPFTMAAAALDKALMSDEHKEEIIEWLFEKHKREQLAAFRAEVYNALISHVGSFRTIHQVKSNFQMLEECVRPQSGGSSSSYPADELRQFADRNLERVLRVTEHKSRWDWRIAMVAIAGIVQIAVGMLVPFLGIVLIGEGINDLMYAGQCLMTPGSFSFRDYVSQKTSSVMLSLATLGLAAGKLLSTCNNNLKHVARMMLRFNTKLASFAAIAKQTLARFAHMILSSTIGHMLSRFFNWIKKFIVEKVLDRIRYFVTSLGIFSPGFVELKKSLWNAWSTVIRNGGTVEEAERTVSDFVSSAENSTSNKWTSRLTQSVASVTSVMTRCYADATNGLKQFGGHVGAEAKAQQNQMKANVSRQSHSDSFDIGKAAKITSKVIDYATKANQVINYVNQAHSVHQVVTHGADRVKDIQTSVQEQVDRLNRAKKKAGQVTEVKCDHDQLHPRFAQLAAETEKRIQDETLYKTLDAVQDMWLQPLLHRKIENLAVDLSDRFLRNLTQSIYGDDGEQPGELVLPWTARYEIGIMDEFHGEDEAYDEFVDTMGEGRPVGMVDMQNACDADGVNVEVVDKDGLYAVHNDGNDTASFSPQGISNNNAPTIRMEFTTNDDGSNHVTLLLPDGRTIDYVPPPGEPPNRCFYHAYTLGLSAIKNPQVPTERLNVTSDDVSSNINRLKEEARSNDRTRYLHRTKLDQTFSHLRVGSTGSNPDLPPGVSIAKDKAKRTESITITASRNTNIRYGTYTQEQKNQIFAEQGGLPTDDCFHAIAKTQGGPSENWNLFAVHRDVNRIQFRRIEDIYARFVNLPGNEDLMVTRKINFTYYGKSKKPWTVQMDIYTDDPNVWYSSPTFCNRSQANIEDNRQRLSAYRIKPAYRAMRREARRAAGENWSGDAFDDIMKKKF